MKKIVLFFAALCCVSFAFAGNNVITYTANAKLEFASSSCLNEAKDNGFGTNQLQNHEFSSGVGTLTFARDVDTIGADAFRDCSGMSSITLPQTLTRIENYAFRNCNSLTAITLPSSLTYIQFYAFWNCSNLRKIVSLATQAPLADTYAFDGIDATATLYTTPEFVADYNFVQGWEEIANVVTTISTLTYTSVGKLTATNVESTNFGANLVAHEFNEDTNVGTFIFDDVIDSIGGAAFYACTTLTAINLPNTLKVIDADAFSSCGLTSINLPDSVRLIGNYAFGNSDNLTSVTLSNNLAEVGNMAFYSCDQLKTIICPTTTVPLAAGNSFDKINSAAVLYVRAELVDSFKAATGWNTIPNILPMSEITYKAGAKLTETTDEEEDGLHTNAFSTSILQHTFADSIGKIMFAGPLDIIGGLAFTGTDILSITIPNSVKTIGYSAFYNCRDLTIANIPDSVTTIGDYAFQACSSLNSIAIPNSVTTIGNYAFGSCYGFDSVVIPNSVQKLGMGLFSDCGQLKYVKLPDTMTTLPDYMFYYCTSLDSIVIPNSVNTIGENAFLYCSALTKVVMPDACKFIDDWAFFGTALDSITIADGTKVIDKSAFQECSNLSKVVLPASVDTIADYAFDHCDTALVVVCYATTVPTAYSHTFTGVTDAAVLYVLNNELVEQYRVAEGWKEFKTILPLNSTPTAIANATISGLYAENGRVVCTGDFRIYDILGRDVTRMNGTLHGVYVVTCGAQVTKIVVK